MNTLSVLDFKDLIFNIRGCRVMIDSDLAYLYGTETKVLKQQVKRNINRFPEDFMFELSKDEKQTIISGIKRLNNLKHSSASIMVFTEQGVAMLSSVLRSPKAVNINIEIMRAFVQYRALLIENSELRKEIESLDKKVNKGFRYILQQIDELKPSSKPSKLKRIGYKNYD